MSRSSPADPGDFPRGQRPARRLSALPALPLSLRAAHEPLADIGHPLGLLDFGCEPILSFMSPSWMKRGKTDANAPGGSPRW
jgi:hypothetical protein